MAPVARSSEFIDVDVPMTILAEPFLRPLVSDKRLWVDRCRCSLFGHGIRLAKMALDAFDLEVGAVDDPFVVVLEADNRFEPLEVVTSLAIISKLSPVLIKVTGAAGCRESQVGDPSILKPFAKPGVVHPALLMALCALNPMLVDEGIAGAFVIKSFFWNIPLRQLRVLSTMILVAIHADLSGLESFCMKAPVVFDEVIDLLVTFEAELSVDFFAHVVTFGAVADPLERGVAFAEFSGRQKLGHGLFGSRELHQKKQGAYGRKLFYQKIHLYPKSSETPIWTTIVTTIKRASRR